MSKPSAFPLKWVAVDNTQREQTMNPYAKSSKAYKQASVTTDDQGALILMLYDGAIRFCKTAHLKIEKKDLEGAHFNLVKAKDIVAELLASLNTESAGEMGNNLRQLYTYIYNRLIDANLQKDNPMIQEVIELLVEVREGWRAIAQPKKTAQPGRFNGTGSMKTVNFSG